MATIFVRHAVADYDAWKRAFDEEESARSKHGMDGHTLHRDPQDPNVVVIALRTDDLSRAQQYATSDDVRQVMMKAGVQGAPEIWFTEDIERKRYS